MPLSIDTIDSGYVTEKVAAIYLLQANNKAMLVDSGTQHSLPAVQAELARSGLSDHDVEWLVLTHIHLDHAGGAGIMMRQFPNARLLVHPRGAPHMVDPSKLIAGTRAVYGQQKMQTLYGDIIAIDAARIKSYNDGNRFQWQGDEFEIYDAPGHALHHLYLHHPKSQSVFTGDAFGLCYQAFRDGSEPFLFPTTTPVQFDPGAMHDTIDKIMRHKPLTIYPTHYGPFSPSAAMVTAIHRHIDRMVELATIPGIDNQNSEDLLARNILNYMCEQLDALDASSADKFRRNWLQMDAQLNAQGLIVWRDRLFRKQH